MYICLESEPAGEICVGELSPKDVKLLKELYKTDKMTDSKFVEEPFTFNKICWLNGIFTNLDGGEFSSDITPNYFLNKKITLPNDDEPEERFFLVYSSLTKQSLEFEFECDGSFDESKLTVEYTSFDFDDIETDLYGYLVGDVITSISYDDEPIEEFFDSELLESSDLTREIYILQKKGSRYSIIYSNINYDDEKWGDFNK